MRDGKDTGMKQKQVLLTRKGGPEVLEVVEPNPYSPKCVEDNSVLKNELVGRARNPRDR